MNLRGQVSDLLSGLYSDQVIDEVSAAALQYDFHKTRKPNYVDIPSDLHDVTEWRTMSWPEVNAGNVDSDVLRHLGVITDDRKLKGPLNHIITRMFTIPRMLPGYLKNMPGEAEKSIYTDPQLLQYELERLTELYDIYFAQAADELSDPDELARRFAILGKLGEEFGHLTENAYPASNSTEAYELFGIFHLFPGNKVVDLTSTSPGVILPTEADPLRFVDSVLELKKNLLRPTYFEMLTKSVDPVMGGGRKRRYFASREGTRNNLLAYPQLVDAAKEILERYLELGKGVFEIRTGDPLPGMKKVTLVGEKGVVYSIRDPEQKEKIAHNLTVLDSQEAERWKEVFDNQWEGGEPIDGVDAVDRLVTQ